MKVLKSFILFLLVSQCALAQDTINQYDANGLRHGVWRKYFPLNHNLRYSGQFNHGKEVGVFKYYDINNDQIPIVTRTFNPNDSTAIVRFYTLDGNLESVGKMQGKKRIDKWVFYDKGGRDVVSEEFYKDGLLDGESRVYYPNGKVTEIVHYVKGKREGNYKRYSSRGFLYQNLTYKNDVLEGLAIYYERETGKILTKGNFKDNKRVGTWEHYQNGKLVSTNQPALKPKKQTQTQN